MESISRRKLERMYGAIGANFAGYRYAAIHGNVCYGMGATAEEARAEMRAECKASHIDTAPITVVKIQD